MFSLIISFFFLNLHLICSTRFHHLIINENDIVPRHLLTFNSPNLSTTYELISTNFQKYFSIKNEKELYAIESLDREYFCKENFCSCSIPCSINLKILSQPGHQIIYLNLTINDLNDNLHHFQFNQIQLQIPENTNNHHRQCYRIPIVNDEDLPETNQFNYQLVGNGSERFEVDEMNGNDLCLRIKNISLDREECDKYDNFWLIAQDKQKQQAKMKIIIQVLDINDNSPSFLTNSTIIHVNESFFGELTCIKAFDPDEGKNGHVIYSFNHIETKFLNYLFLNNQTGCLTIVQPLLLTSTNLLSLLQLNNRLLITIRAQDLGSRMSSTLPVYHSLELIIHDVNDHKPRIEVRQIINQIKNNSQINIIENTIGFIAMITIEDIDQGLYGEVTFNFIVQSTNRIHQKAFQIKPISIKHYKLQLIKPLDYELETSLALYLDAMDGGGEHTRFVMNIRIVDINDMEPKFDNDHYHFVVNIQSSLSPFNSIIIGQVHATDGDTSTDSLIYSLNSNLFRINSRTGQVSLISPLSINMTDTILTFYVNVTDGEYINQARVTISIEGYNHSPKFEKQEYYFEINENIPIRTIIGQIIGKDNDSSSKPRGELTYSLHPITSHSEFFFHISHTGQVVVARIPDAEQQQLHQFIITVRDHGTPPLSSEAKLVIKVNDINEYCPILVNIPSEPYIFISRDHFSKPNSSKMFTYRLSAFDTDISDQSNITFRLLPSQYSNLFHLNANGLLTVKELPLKISSIVELRYSLSDHFSPNSCITQDTLIILIGETSNDRNYLINQYKEQLHNFQHHRLITQNFEISKRKNPEIIFVFLVFSFCTFIVLIGILTLLFILCCQRRKKRKRQRSITTKSSYLINPSELLDQSPYSVITDSSTKSSRNLSIV